LRCPTLVFHSRQPGPSCCGRPRRRVWPGNGAIDKGFGVRRSACGPESADVTSPGMSGSWGKAAAEPNCRQCRV
jgi:hypothetical protein